jgi:hypothetical protein
VSRTATQRARDVAQARSRMAMLDRVGVPSTEIGRVFNRATAVDDDISNITIPDTTAGLEEMLGDVDKLHVLAKAGKLKNVLAAYARKTVNADLDMRRQVNELAQVAIQDMLKDAKLEGLKPSSVLDLTGDDAAKAAFGFAKSGKANARARLYNSKAMGAKLDKDFANGLEYWQTIWHQAGNTADRQEKLSRLRNAFSSNVPSEGGFLIPETLRSEILRVALETSIVRSRARVIPMETLRVPFPAIDSISNTTSVYGGIQAYWTEEGASLNTTQASFSNVVLDAKKLTAYCEVPNELIADSIGSFEALMDEIFPEVSRWACSTPATAPSSRRRPRPASPPARSSGRTSSGCTPACCRCRCRAPCGSPPSTPSRSWRPCRSRWAPAGRPSGLTTAWRGRP